MAKSQRNPRRLSKLGEDSEMHSVRLRADQSRVIRRLAGPPPHQPSESEIIRQLIDDGLKARKRVARC